MFSRLARRVALAIAVFAFSIPAFGQQFPTIPTDTVIGRTQNGSGPAQAIPFSQLIALMLQQSALTIPTVNTNSIIFKGSTSGQATLQAQAVAGTPTLNLPNTSGTIPSNATSPIVIDPASGNISCPTCATSSGAANPVIVSRAAAQALNLSGLSALSTLGYAAPGDGGGATFVQVGSTTPFIDSFVTGSSISGGATCTNGSYFGVQLTGGTGSRLIGVVTVSGGVVTAINYTYSPGYGYKVGDVLTIPNSVTGCATAATITVTSVSTPLGSFTDAVGTRFQIVQDFRVNVHQFGAFPSVTDNFAQFQAAAFFAGYSPGQVQTPGGGGLEVPNGFYTLCGSAGAQAFEIPQGVNFWGPSNQGATINACSTWSATTPFIYLCDPNWHFTCFNATTNDISIQMSSTNFDTGVPVVFSNNDQDFGGLYRTYIYGGPRSCVLYTEGFGGASSFHIWKLSCSADSANPQIFLQAPIGSTTIQIEDAVLGGSSSGSLFQTGPGIFYGGGMVSINGGHAEEMPVGIEVSNTAANSNGMISIHNFNAASGAPAPACTGVIQLDAGNTPGNMIASMIPAGSCTNVITNGQSAGAPVTTTITKPVTCVSGACS